MVSEINYAPPPVENFSAGQAANPDLARTVDICSTVSLAIKSCCDKFTSNDSTLVLVGQFREITENEKTQNIFIKLQRYKTDVDSATLELETSRARNRDCQIFKTNLEKGLPEAQKSKSALKSLNNKIMAAQNECVKAEKAVETAVTRLNYAQNVWERSRNDQILEIETAEKKSEDVYKKLKEVVDQVHEKIHSSSKRLWENV
jgi:hypothetical protein